jgi:hypothetical protein
MSLKPVCASALAAVLALSSAQAQTLGNDQRNPQADAAVAALLAIGIVVAAVKNRHDQFDEERQGEPFSPASGVTCLPIPRKCYENGYVSWRWTQREFG